MAGVPAGEPHLAVVLLVVQHVHQVIEQLPTVAADEDVRIAWWRGSAGKVWLAPEFG